VVSVIVIGFQAERPRMALELRDLARRIEKNLGAEREPLVQESGKVFLLRLRVPWAVERYARTDREGALDAAFEGCAELVEALGVHDVVLRVV
jgi:hypothetical protein